MRRTRSGIMIAAALTVAVAACKEDRASVFSPVGPPSYDAPSFGRGVSLPGVGTVVNQPAGRIGVSPHADTIVFVLTDLRDLAGGAGYVFWAADSGAAPVRLTGDILEFFMRDSTVGGVPVEDPLTGDVIQVPDTNVISNVDTYSGTTDLEIAEIEARMAATGAAGMNSAIVGIEASPASPTGAIQFLWRRIGVVGTGSMWLGNFGGPSDVATLCSCASDTIAENADLDYVYSVTSSRLIAGFRGDEVSIDLDQIGRPPVGFQYRGWLIDDNGMGTLISGLLSQADGATDLGDPDTDDALVAIGFDPRTDQAIPAARIRNCVSGSTVSNPPGGSCGLNFTMSTDTLSAFTAQSLVAITLEPKAAPATLGRGVVWSAAVPPIVKKGGIYR